MGWFYSRDEIEYRQVISKETSTLLSTISISLYYPITKRCQTSSEILFLYTELFLFTSENNYWEIWLK